MEGMMIYKSLEVVELGRAEDLIEFLGPRSVEDGGTQPSEPLAASYEDSDE
jgi:hypothetical protein